MSSNDADTAGMTAPALLKVARDLAQRVLAPQAQAVDRAGAPPVENLRCLAEAGLLSFPVPAEYGGSGASGAEVRLLLEILASACGVTTFIVFQHFGMCGQLARSENRALAAELLPLLARGRRFGTIAFSHLRRPGAPAVRVEETPGGYVFNGVAPWATGWGVADEILLAGSLPDGRSLWVAAPATESEHLQPSPTMPLCAATASATVSLRLDDLRVGRERWVKTITAEQLVADTYAGMLSHSTLSLGVARGAIRLLRARGAARQQPAAFEAAQALEHEVDAARAQIEVCAENLDTSAGHREVLRTRACCINLGVRAAHAAVIASGGVANSLDHPAQRLFREALLYSVTALTGDLQEVALASVSRSGDRSVGA